MEPSISVIVICHNMRREAPRTLYSLSRQYQLDAKDIDYEVLVVDNGSSEPLDERLVGSFGPEFRYTYFQTNLPSPTSAINAAVRDTTSRYVVICIDGARIVSPGMLKFIVAGTKLSERPVISSLAWHLGHKVQKLAMLEGYDQRAEDRILADCDWEQDGYLLFTIACLAPSSAGGWFKPPSESNCIALPRTMFEELGGFDEAFVTRGGGYANLDFHKRACEAISSDLIILLGEGTFHQFHGGAATNARPEVHPGREFSEEYRQIRGKTYSPPMKEPLYLGTLTAVTREFIKP